MPEFAILNTDKNRFLTSANGRGIWDHEATARRTMNDEFGGGSHLEIVLVARTRRIDQL